MDETGFTCSLRLEIERGRCLMWPDGADRPDPDWFEPDALAAAGRARVGGTGRGATVYFEDGERTLVLRHYRRGGFPQRLSEDAYLRAGLRRSRPWRELALLTRLHAGGLPVPRPVGARVVLPASLAPVYRGDLITEYLADARTLTEVLRHGAIDPEKWEAIGVTLARFHAVGVDHADLNAHNIVLGTGDAVHLIDFDRARLRRHPGRWAARNLTRLRRSLDKLAGSPPGIAFDEAAWQRLRQGYRRG